jgi:hypothetical protein
VCMSEIIIAGIGGSKLSNNAPECMMLNWGGEYDKILSFDINNSKFFFCLWGGRNLELLISNDRISTCPPP